MSVSDRYLLAARVGYDGAPVAALVTPSTLLGVVSLPFALDSLRQAMSRLSRYY
jgi:malonate transporter and related proteins